MTKHRSFGFISDSTFLLFCGSKVIALDPFLVNLSADWGTKDFILVSNFLFSVWSISGLMFSSCMVTYGYNLSFLL